MKRITTVIMVSVLALAVIVTACGNDQKAATNTPAQTQPAQGGEQAANPEDPLSQFPALKLPYTVEPNATITEYQGGKLTAKEFEDFLRTISFLNPQQREMIEAADQESLKNFAREFTATKILAARADDAIRKESQNTAEKTFDKVKSQYIAMLGKDAGAFDKLMQNQGLTRELVVSQMALINDSIGVLKQGITDAELQKQYDQADKAQFTTASVRHILISTESRKPEEALKLANELIARIKKGEDFAALAKQYSDDPGSKEEGGLYKDADVNQWVPEFKNAALTLPIGQVSEPVKTDYGYHVMRVEDRKVKSFAEAKDQMRQQALETKYGEFVQGELDKLITKWNIPQPKQAG
ncbi:foldase [Brevibacillus sp. SYP-B805]|uniref:peptidylprolyl isomerase n=1 Tax=Brevibacillus sp. SYP-B805 TaxID=1578199 RepID=UPI0013E9C639|nr:peptidylprolyl isomerase [Brevibacillus sp. SYP-B805]NGQ96476.1 foldase [Brevibacillus sp. SYP-B805]